MQFKSYRQFSDGSSGPAESMKLIRGLGDKIIAVDGILTENIPPKEIIAMIRESAKKKFAIFRLLQSNIQQEDARNSSNDTDTIADDNLDEGVGAATRWGEIKIGSRVGIYWEDDKQFYPCTVTKKRYVRLPPTITTTDGRASQSQSRSLAVFNANVDIDIDTKARREEHFVLYDDGESEWTNMSTEKLRWLLDDDDTNRNEIEGDDDKITEDDVVQNMNDATAKDVTVSIAMAIAAAAATTETAANAVHAATSSTVIGKKGKKEKKKKYGLSSSTPTLSQGKKKKKKLSPQIKAKPQNGNGKKRCLSLPDNLSSNSNENKRKSPENDAIAWCYRSLKASRKMSVDVSGTISETGED